MLTAYAKDPRPSHTLKVVDNSLDVNRESHFGACFAPYACGDSTEGLDALREFDEQPFAVTLGGRQVMVEVHPAPPALPLPHPFIPTTLIEGVYVPEGMMQ